MSTDIATIRDLHASSWSYALATWWTILKISIEERLVYRGDFAFGTLMRFLPLVTQVFLWAAVYAGSREGGGTIAGFTYDEMIAYFLLTQISRAFSSMPGLSAGISLLIRNGDIKKYLIQPIGLIEFLLLSRVAHKLVYYVVAAGPFALVFYLCRGFFSGWPEPHVLAAFLLSLVMAFLLGFFLEATIGLVGFWLLEVTSLLFAYMLISFFLSGMMFPVELLEHLGNGFLGRVAWATPFPYLAYFPAAIFLGKIEGPDLAWGLLAELGWVLFFIGLARLVLNRGLRRYSGFGG